MSSYISFFADFMVNLRIISSTNKLKLFVAACSMQKTNCVIFFKDVSVSDEIVDREICLKCFFKWHRSLQLHFGLPLPFKYYS